MVEISEFFRVTTRIQTGGVATRDFGRGLLLTTDDSLAAGGSGKAKYFSGLDLVKADFAGDSEPVRAATRWFSYADRPQGLYIGRWAHDDVPTTLRGGPPAATGAAPLNSANGSFEVNGQKVTVDLSGAATYAAIATAVQTAIQGLAGIFAGAEFEFDAGAFVLTLAGGQAIAGGVFTPSDTGTDISAALGMAADSGPSHRQGHDAETPSNAISEILRLLTQRPTYVAFDAGAPATYGTPPASARHDVWSYADASRLVFGFTDTSDGARDAANMTSDAYLAHASQLQNTLVCAGDEGRESHLGALGALSSINWDQPASIITLFGKVLGGVLPTRISESEFEVLKARRTNVYTRVGGDPTFVEGWMARNGYWSDAVVFNLWMANELELATWNAARASRRLTIAILRASLVGAMRKGVRNGGLQPGRTVSPETKADIIATTGNQEFSGVLSSGYLIHIGALADQTEVEITNRRGPPVKIWAYRLRGDPPGQRGPRVPELGELP